MTLKSQKREKQVRPVTALWTRSSSRLVLFPPVVFPSGLLSVWSTSSLVLFPSGPLPVWSTSCLALFPSGPLTAWSWSRLVLFPLVHFPSDPLPAGPLPARPLPARPLPVWSSSRWTCLKAGQGGRQRRSGPSICICRGVVARRQWLDENDSATPNSWLYGSKCMQFNSRW